MESLCQGKQIDFTSLDYKITYKKLGRSEILISFASHLLSCKGQNTVKRNEQGLQRLQSLSLHMNTAVVSKRRPAIHTFISDDSKLYLVYVGVRKITTSLAPVKL